MPKPTYTLVNKITLASSSADITFSGIPQGYKDLILVADIRSASNPSGTEPRVRFNGDAGNNYIWVQGASSGSSSFSNAGTFTAMPFTPNAFVSTTTNEPLIFHMMDYSAIDKHKTTISKFAQTSSIVSMIGGRWANTTAITSVSVIMLVSTIAAGSTFSLYGIAG